MLNTIQDILPILQKSRHEGVIITTGYYKTIFFTKHGEEPGWYIQPNTYYDRKPESLATDEQLIEYLNKEGKDDTHYKPTTPKLHTKPTN